LKACFEQQQVRTLPDDQGQYQPRFLTAGEAFGVLGNLIALEAKAAKVVPQLLLRFLRGKAGQVLQRRLIRPQELQLVLGEIAKLDALRKTNITAGGGKLARQQLDQRRFTRAVATQQANARARDEVKLDRVKNGAIAVARTHHLARALAEELPGDADPHLPRP